VFIIDFVPIGTLKSLNVNFTSAALFSGQHTFQKFVCRLLK
jgi:hypothetical protein